MVTPLGKAIEFFREFGLFDVVLPFLLVFTIVFAILEKTRILGTVKSGKEEIPNKNLNSMVAFVVGLLVVATANVVGFINESLPNVIIVVVVAFSYLLMIGIFLKTEEFNFSDKHKGWFRAFMIITFIAVLAIAANAIKVDAQGHTALDAILSFFIDNWSGAIVTSIIFLVVIIFAIIIVTKSGSKEKKEGS